jgi:hypothetical protein
MRRPALDAFRALDWGKIRRELDELALFAKALGHELASA